MRDRFWRLLITMTLICCFPLFSNQEEFCNGDLNGTEMKMNFFCDSFVVKSFIKAHKEIQNTNKYLNHKKKFYKQSVDSNCTFNSPEYLIKNCTQPSIFKSCDEAIKYGVGVYLIESPDPKLKPFMVYCCKDYNGLAYTVIQRRRGKGHMNFHMNRNWNEYKIGFGDLLNDFWLGLEKILALSYRRPCQLWVKLKKDDSKTTQNVFYEVFQIGGEREEYFLKTLQKYSGSAQDMLTASVGKAFSTKDRRGSAARFWGGWWRAEDNRCNLNGPYRPQSAEKYTKIHMWDDEHAPIYYCRMAVRERPNI